MMPPPAEDLHRVKGIIEDGVSEALGLLPPARASRGEVREQVRRLVAEQVLRCLREWRDEGQA